MTVNLHHTHLVTADVEAFCCFFQTHFDATVVFDDHIDGDRNVFLTVGTGRIHLFESSAAPTHARNLFHHLGLMVEQLEELVTRLRADGVTVSEITAVPGGGFAMAQGPDGLLLELFEVTSAEHRQFFVSSEST